MASAPFWDDAPDDWDTLVIGGRKAPGIARVTGKAARKIDVRSPHGGDGARLRDRGYEVAELEVEIRIWTREQLEQLTQLLEEVHPRRINAAAATAATARRAGEDAERTQEQFAQRQRDLQRNPELGTDPIFQRELNGLGRRAGAAARRARAQEQAARRPTQPSRTPVDVAHPALALLGIRQAYVRGVSVPELQNGVMTAKLQLLEWTPPTPAPRPSHSSHGGEIDGMRTAFDEFRASSRPTPSTPSRLGG